MSPHRNFVGGGARLVAAGVVRFVWLYQRFISPLFPARCRFVPSCSAYTAQAVATHGVGRGLWLAFRRLLRCHPFHGGGFDLVPPVGNHRVRVK